MNIAYLISAHTDPEQLARLVSALEEEAHCFIHIDRKSDLLPFLDTVQGERVHFLRERIDVRWGTINEWDYQLLLLRAALAHPTPFDRLVTLSGLDYPLWGNKRIAQCFENNAQQEFLAAMPMQESNRALDIFRSPRPFTQLPLIGNRGNQRLSILLRKLIRATGFRTKFTFRVAKQEWREYKGAAWWAISEPLARHIVNTYDSHRREIRRHFIHQHCPAETLVPTIAFNSPWRERCFHFTQSSSLEEKTLLHHIEYTDAIRIWRAGDIDTLLASGKMFARKLTTEHSTGLITLINEARERD